MLLRRNERQVFGAAARGRCKQLDKGADCPGTRTNTENDYDSKSGKAKSGHDFDK
jgi:hypothetical protein